MRRLASSLLAAFALLTAALQPGAAVFAQPACPAPLEGLRLDAAVHESSLIVIGTWIRTDSDPTKTDIASIVFQPEAFLKGPTSAREIRFGSGLPGPCQASGAARTGDRLLLIANGDPEHAMFPEPERAYVLREGRATTLLRGDTTSTTEAELVSRIRTLTGQYAVPAGDDGESAGIDWGKTVLPVGFAVLALFGVGLVLMRIWHRIDPS